MVGKDKVFRDTVLSDCGGKIFLRLLDSYLKKSDTISNYCFYL